MEIAKQLSDLIGNTPLLELSRFAKAQNATGRIIGKLESFNPLGSVKDRVALSMIEDAESRRILHSGSTIVEATSGNTGIGLAYVSSVKGYRLILTMPETMSIERRNLLKALGAEIILTKGKAGMKGAIAKAEELQKEIPDAVSLRQFDNPANPAVHYRTTAEEIWRDTGGEVDIFVAGIGTGGTISGCAKRLKELKADMQIVGVEPEDSAVLSGKPAGAHKIQGIGAGFVPAVYDASVVDKIVPVSNEDAIRTARQVAKTEGLLVGISSGAAMYAALRLSQLPENKGKNIIIMLPDTGERYLSTELYAFDEYPL